MQGQFSPDVCTLPAGVRFQNDHEGRSQPPDVTNQISAAQEKTDHLLASEGLTTPRGRPFPSFAEDILPDQHHGLKYTLPSMTQTTSDSNPLTPRRRSVLTPLPQCSNHDLASIRSGSAQDITSHAVIDLREQLSAANARISELEATVRQVIASVTDSELVTAGYDANDDSCAALASPMPERGRLKPRLSMSLSQIVQKQRARGATHNGAEVMSTHARTSSITSTDSMQSNQSHSGSPVATSRATRRTSSDSNLTNGGALHHTESIQGAVVRRTQTSGQGQTSGEVLGGLEGIIGGAALSRKSAGALKMVVTTRKGGKDGNGAIVSARTTKNKTQVHPEKTSPYLNSVGSSEHHSKTISDASEPAGTSEPTLNDSLATSARDPRFKPGVSFQGSITRAFSRDSDMGGGGEKGDDDLIKNDTYVWTFCSSNAYGAFIHVALQAGLLKAFAITLPMVATSIFVQSVFSTQLLVRHWRDFEKQIQIERNIDLCAQPWMLQTCATFIFVTLMLNNIPGMWKAARLALFSTHHAGGDGETIGKKLSTDMGDRIMIIHHSLPARCVIFFFGVFCEMCTWTMLLGAGIVWINSASDVDLVIRSTVSVMFVLNVDELIYEACCMSNIITDVEETKYRVRDLNPNVVRQRLSESFVQRLLVRDIVFSGHNLAAQDNSLIHGRTSDAYLVFSQEGIKLGKTEVVSHNLNPVWPRICLKLKKKRDVLIECFDYDFGRKDDLIGEVTVSGKDLASLGNAIEFQLQNKELQNMGTIRIEEIIEGESLIVSRFAGVKHFVDVYLYLFILMGISVGVTAIFKGVVLEDCNLTACYWGPCDPTWK